MIIYGAKGKSLKAEPFEGKKCAHCGNTTQFAVPVVRYIHIFFIPIFLIKKTAFLICGHCKKQTEAKDFEKEIKVDIKEKAYENTKLFKYFIGLLVIPAFVLFITLVTGM